ncbi:MAG TPA: isochorismatase family protein [Aestuariivirga sp.]|nr:isochorismatase family protein [Aestuariivirga sp.]
MIQASASRRFSRCNSCLIVVDAQVGFLNHAEPDLRHGLEARIAWLGRAAAELRIPCLVTLEEPHRNGPLLPNVARALPSGVATRDKQSFGLAGQPDILAAVKAMGRSHCVLVGMETDVCVAQSALGLLDHGFSVAAVTDACFSLPPFHAAGLARMAAAGVTLLTSKALYFEWAENLFTHERLKAALDPPPDGISY